MKTITLKQPWASLVANGYKEYEFRSWKIKYRGDILIHAGKGIDKEEIKYIWNKYYHNEKKHKRNAFGTGLGLSIVKTILESHNYKYGVKSVKNKGTTFYFEIDKKNML